MWSQAGMAKLPRPDRDFDPLVGRYPFWRFRDDVKYSVEHSKSGDERRLKLVMTNELASLLSSTADRESNFVIHMEGFVRPHHS